MIWALACLATAAPPAPHGMVFSFDRFALYGPIQSLGRIYPLDKEERPPDSVGDAVEVVLGDDPPAGDYLLRLPIDEAKLPVSARPAHVRVAVKALIGWSDAPARLRKGPDGRHALFVPVETEGVYAVVLGAGAGHVPVDDMLGRELDRFAAWVTSQGGADVTAELEPATVRRIGAIYRADVSGVRFVRSKTGTLGAGVFDGVLGFFEVGEGRSMRAFTLGERVYLFGGGILAADADKKKRRTTLAHELWHVVQARRLGERYFGAWVSALLAKGLRDHPMEVEADKRAAAALSRL